MVEFRRVPGNGKIPASIEKLSGRVMKYGRLSAMTENGRIRASIEKLYGRVLQKGRINVNTEIY